MRLDIMIDEKNKIRHYQISRLSNATNIYFFVYIMTIVNIRWYIYIN